MELTRSRSRARMTHLGQAKSLKEYQIFRCVRLCDIVINITSITYPLINIIVKIPHILQGKWMGFRAQDPFLYL